MFDVCSSNKALYIYPPPELGDVDLGGSPGSPCATHCYATRGLGLYHEDVHCSSGAAADGAGQGRVRLGIKLIEE